MQEGKEAEKKPCVRIKPSEILSKDKDEGRDATGGRILPLNEDEKYSSFESCRLSSS